MQTDLHTVGEGAAVELGGQHGEKGGTVGSQVVVGCARPPPPPHGRLHEHGADLQPLAPLAPTQTAVTMALHPTSLLPKRSNVAWWDVRSGATER